MLSNYLRAAIGNLLRYKQYAAINIGGMVLGIACAIMAILFADFELSYDKWISDSDQIYRVETNIRLSPDASITTIEDRLEDFTNAHYVHPNPLRKSMTPSIFVHFALRLIQDIHLNARHPNELKQVGSIGTVFGGLAIAFAASVVLFVRSGMIRTAAIDGISAPDKEMQINNA